MFLVVLVTEVGKKSGRIIKIFDVVADMILQILPTLQFILLFYTFGSGEAGELTFMIINIWFDYLIKVVSHYNVRI